MGLALLQFAVVNMYNSDYQGFWLTYGVNNVRVYVTTTDPGVNFGNLSNTALVFTGIIPINSSDNGGVNRSYINVQRVCKGTFVVFTFLSVHCAESITATTN